MPTRQGIGSAAAFFIRLIAVSDRKAFCLINSTVGVNNTLTTVHEPGNSCKHGLIKLDGMMTAVAAK